jgi:hypothetical protein
VQRQQQSQARLRHIVGVQAGRAVQAMVCMVQLLVESAKLPAYDGTAQTIYKETKKG